MNEIAPVVLDDNDRLSALPSIRRRQHLLFSYLVGSSARSASAIEFRLHWSDYESGLCYEALIAGPLF
jgi:hypothetical protein